MFSLHKIAHFHLEFVNMKLIKINARTNNLSLWSFSLSLLSLLDVLDSLENIFTDLDHNLHHCRHHRQMMMKIKTLADHEHSQLVRWLQLFQMIKIYPAGFQRITSKKVYQRNINIIKHSYNIYILNCFSCCYLRLLCGQR